MFNIKLAQRRGCVMWSEQCLAYWLYIKHISFRRLNLGIFEQLFRMVAIECSVTEEISSRYSSSSHVCIVNMSKTCSQNQGKLMFDKFIIANDERRMQVCRRHSHSTCFDVLITANTFLNGSVWLGSLARVHGSPGYVARIPSIQRDETVEDVGEVFLFYFLLLLTKLDFNVAIQSWHRYTQLVYFSSTICHHSRHLSLAVREKKNLFLTPHIPILSCT